MTKEQLAELAAGPPTPLGLERLLEERKRLLDELRAMLNAAIGESEPTTVVETRAAAAIAFAEEEAPG